MKTRIIENWPVFCSVIIILTLLAIKGRLPFYFPVSFGSIYIVLLIKARAGLYFTAFVFAFVSLSVIRVCYFCYYDGKIPIGDGKIIIAKVTGNSENYNWNIHIPIKIKKIDNYSNKYLLSNLRATLRIPEQMAYLYVRQTIKEGDFIVLRGDILTDIDYSYYFNIGLNVQRRYYIRPVRLFSITRSSLTSLTQHIAASFKDLSPETVSLLVPLLTGNRSYMSCKDRMVIQKSGLFHVFVVSGFHIGLIAFILFLPLRLFVSKKSAIPIIMIILLLYLNEIGYPISAMRAFIMLSIYFVSSLLKRNTSTIHILYLAIFALLFINPSDFFSYSFIMSILAVGGIVFALPFVQNIHCKHYLAEYFKKTWAVSCFALLFIAPALLISFGYFSLWGTFVFPFVSIIIFLFVVLSMIRLILPINIISNCLLFLSDLFRVLIPDNIISLFIIGSRFSGEYVFYFVILYFTFLILIYSYFLPDKSIIFALVFIVLALILYLSSRPVDLLQTMPENMAFDRERGILVNWGRICRERDRQIREILSTQSIKKLYVITAPDRYLFSNALQYKGLCSNIQYIIIDSGNDKHSNLLSYTLMRKHEIAFRVINPDLMLSYYY